MSCPYLLDPHFVCLKAQARRLDPAGKRDLARISGLGYESRVSELG